MNQFKIANFLKYSFISLSIMSLTACGGGGGGGNTEKSAAQNSAEYLFKFSRKCPENMTCSDMEVPKDYSNLNGETVKVFYGVHRAEDPDNRIGILLVNFGGPGGSSVNSSGYMIKKMFPQSVLDHFDIVGMDPRGSGGSVFSKELTECAINSKTNKNENNESCQATFTKVAPFMGSNTIVEDMEALRVHLGESKLNYLGYSYGVRIGSLYANKYPENIRAWILDSAGAPDETNFLMWLNDQAAGRDLIVSHRLGEDELLVPSVDGTKKYQLEEMVKFSVDGGDINHQYDVTNEHFWTSVWALQSRESSWRKSDWTIAKPYINQFLDKDNSDRDNSSYLDELIARQKEDDDRDTTNDKLDELRSDAMFAAVVCTDESEPVSESERNNSLQSFLDSSNIYGYSSFHYSSKMCVNWPARRDPIVTLPNLESTLNQENVHVLIIGGEYDTATPYAGVLKMKAKFGGAATLLTVNDYVTHAFSYTFDIKWLDDLTTSYLLNPENPMQDQEGKKDTYGGISTKSLNSNGVIIFREQPINPARKVRMGPHSPRF